MWYPTTLHQAKEVVVEGSSFNGRGDGQAAQLHRAEHGDDAPPTTDAGMPSATKTLKAASDATFNTLNVDPTSTNHTAMLLASAAAGGRS